MTNYIPATGNRINIALKDVTFNHPRFVAYTPSFEPGVNPQYSVQVSGIDPEVAMDLKEAGAPVVVLGTDEAGEPVFGMNLKTYTQNRKGESRSIGVYDKDREEMSMEDRAKVGSGSRGNLVGFMFHYSNEHGTGYSTRIEDIQVMELVERQPETPQERLKRLFG